MIDLASLESGIQNIMRIPDDAKREGLIVASKETLFGYLVDEEITDDVYKRLMQLFDTPRP